MPNAVELAQYYLNEALRLSSAAIVSLDIARAERLRVWLLDTWKYPEILPSEIVQSAPITALRERPTANKALAALEEGSEVRGKIRKLAYRIVKHHS